MNRVATPLLSALLSVVLLTYPASSAEPAVQPLPLRAQPGSLQPLPASTPAGLTLHVSPQGNDHNDGTPSRPFATLERARDVMRARRERGPLSDGGVEVIVHAGEYRVPRTFTLAESDSGTDPGPIVFRAAPGEKPVFRGGARLAGWRPLRESDAYPQLPSASRRHLRIADLRPAGITNLMPLKLGGFASGHGFRTHPAHELFFNGKAMDLARGPNEGFLRIKDVAVKDGTKGYDRQGSKTGKFLVETDRLAQWANEPDLLLYGYWFWDWADSYERVAHIEPASKLITLAQPWHNYGFSIGAPFYAVNALCELDAPGEWYLDRASSRVLFYPPSDPENATLELSLLDAPMLKLENVSRVSFIGLTWELGAADAIQVRGGANVLFAGCVVRRFAGNGIQIQGGRQHRLRSCDIYSMGRGGVILGGGDRKTLTPGNHSVENCEIFELSRIDHTYTPAVLVDGVGARIAWNRLHDIRSSALRVEGNDHLVEYNEIFNAVTESDDQGAVDMFGNPTYRGNVYRYNYFHHIGNWRGAGEQPKCGQAGIRLDDAICGTRVFANVFERCSAGKIGFGGVQIHGGKDNIIENNLFIDCAAVISCTPWNEKRWQEHVGKALDAPQVDRALYLQRYPQLNELRDHANRNHIRRNLAWRCGELLRRAPANLENTNNIVLAEKDFEWNPARFRGEVPGLDPIPFQQIGLHRDPPFRLE